MKEDAEKTFPDLEQFEAMPIEDKVKLFTALPIPAQKLLIGCSAFAGSVRPEMAIPVSQLSPDEYEQAKEVLSQTPYFSETEGGRLQVVDPMRQFINTDLRKVWEKQKKN